MATSDGSLIALPRLRRTRRPPVSSLVPPLRATRTLGRVLATLYVAFVLALLVTPWQQSARGAGRVIAYSPIERQQVVQAPVEGRILRWHVTEGSRVRKGDPIVDLTDNDPAILERMRRERDAIAARVTAAQARLTAIEARRTSLSASRRTAVTAAGSRAGMAGDRLRAAEQAVAAAQAQERVAGLNLDRQKALFSDGLASKRALELAEAEAVKAATERQRTEAALAATTRERSALALDRDKIDTDGLAAISDAEATAAAARAEISAGHAELARIDVRLARQEAQAITAPCDATIQRVLLAPGTAIVKSGERLALLVPDTDERAVELWVDGNDVPLLSVGRTVRMQFEGWPAIQFSGWPSIAVGTFGGKVALIDAADDGKGHFRVLVQPDGGEPWPSGQFLRQGTRAHGWVLLNRVSLGYELWRQFNGFPPTVAKDEASAASYDKK